jgi:hypothetical protein
MPMIDLECVSCGKEWEAFYHASDVPDAVDCECGSLAQRVYRFDNRPRAVTTQVLFLKDDGNYYVPAHPDAPMPADCQRVELHGAREIRKATAQMTAEQYRKWEAAQKGREIFYGAAEAESRSHLRHLMKHMSGPGRDFAQYCIDRNNQRPRRKFRGECYAEAVDA